MNQSFLAVLLVSGVVFGTPLLFAGLGELISQRSGMMNLGLEGMVLVGAVVAFWVSQTVGGSEWIALAIAVLAAMLAGALMALIYGILTITLRGNQVLSGLALSIFGGSLGLSTYLAHIGELNGQVGRHHFEKIRIPLLKDLPIVGPALFEQDLLVYLSWVCVAAAAFYLYRTRFGLYLRAVGENPQAADSMGVNVVAYRYVHLLVGGAFSGIGGAYYTLAITPSWTNGMTTGTGWIAVGLVVLAFWRPGLLLAGAYLFGIVTSLGVNLQARGVHLPPELFSSLPYIMTIVVLVFTQSVWAKRRVGSPASLGAPYARESH